MPLEDDTPPLADTDGPKEVWTAPRIVTLDLTSAAGATSGPRCDRHGSLSRGTGCP